MAGIFISYRREDSADVTGRIRDRLESTFGREAVFTDVDSIPLGVDFKAYITDRVGRCDCLLPVIGPRWLSVTDSNNRRRLDDPRDIVRAEIEGALTRNVPVIPLLVQGASMPTADQLPESLRPLASRNGLPVRPDPDFRFDMERLTKGIAAEIQHPPPKSTWVRRFLSHRMAAGYVVGSLVVLVAVLWIAHDREIEDRPTPSSPEQPRGQTSPDWRTASAEVRTVDGVEYYEVDFRQGLTARAVCSLVRKVPGQFATDHKVCQAFYPHASVKTALSGDLAVVYCTGHEEGFCGAHKNACVICQNCKLGVDSGEWAGHLYSKMFTTCAGAS